MATEHARAIRAVQEPLDTLFVNGIGLSECEMMECLLQWAVSPQPRCGTAYFTVWETIDLTPMERPACRLHRLPQTIECSIHVVVVLLLVLLLILLHRCPDVATLTCSCSSSLPHSNFENFFAIAILQENVLSFSGPIKARFVRKFLKFILVKFLSSSFSQHCSTSNLSLALVSRGTIPTTAVIHLKRIK